MNKALVDLALAQPGDIIGYGKNGKPWRLIGGGSEGGGIDTPGGIIVGEGIEPSARPASVGTHPAMRENNNGDVPAQPTQNGPSWDDVEKARREERDKLYADRKAEQDRIKAMETELAEMRKEREEREARRQERERQRQNEAKKAEEEELSAKELLARRDEEFRQWQQTQQDQMTALQQQIAERDAIIAREREYQQFVDWRRQRIEQERENIAPQLIDLVQGESVEEVEQSITGLIERTNAILDEFAQQQQAARQGMRGVTPTAPPVGPLENQDGARQLSPQEIASLPMSEYAKLRPQLLGAASRSAQSGGLYGG